MRLDSEHFMGGPHIAYQKSSDSRGGRELPQPLGKPPRQTEGGELDERGIPHGGKMSDWGIEQAIEAGLLPGLTRLGVRRPRTPSRGGRRTT